ncbi:transcription factor Opi1-domain-containing protein [Gilbertella persicaria]|uniref:Clock-controlled protein 8 n=1 Tax=Rhizopus stolonifer TaxID=4846 RepID=A0A367IXG2_RHIST|nr:transcription factor Opi1-domain-containing protein [Gilbertella persicaria]KAI8053172.1 transcription factor Opi1-domain-containing protein [Gilbertella persicaria]RCH82368.1 hypothetical protein CU098_001531 [Rhizopus stolonifer]
MTQPSSAMSITQLCNSEDSNENIQLPPIQQQEHFIRRLPLVHSALKAYENSSSVVKYGAEMIESYAGPIYDKLGYDRKLKQEEDEDTVAATTALARASLYDHHQEINHRPKDRKSRPTSRSTSPHRPYKLHRPAKSRWQQIVFHAGSAAGTTAAVISEESMKCLKYCLSWLQYAIGHIDQQMNILRQFLVSLATGSSNRVHHDQVSSVKKEIVDTLRKVVEVVSKYAGSGLPEQAKISVRSFILELPSRWAVLNQKPKEEHPLHETSIRLLDFGGESIDMLKSVSTVFSDTIDRAELWLKRLKVVSPSSMDN